MSARSDIPFSRDPASRMMPWVIGFMAFIACLALAGAFSLDAFAESWEEGLSGTLTVQIPPPADDAIPKERLDAQVDEALRAIRQTRGVIAAQPVPNSEMQALLEPWLGGAIDPRDLPLPRLIAVELSSGTPVDLPDLRRRLQAIVPDITVDDHGLWRQRLVDFMRSLQLVALSVVLVVASAAAVMVVFATRGALLAHWETIALLHLIGAHDSYIARQFQGQASRAGLKGAAGGTAAAAAMVVGLGHAAAATGAELPNAFVLRPLDWVALALVPPVTMILAMAAARRTVVRALARMV